MQPMLRSTLATLLLAATAVRAESPLPHFLPNSELEGYLEEAVAAHPAIAAKEAAWRSALERIPQARSLEDPMLEYSQILRSTRIRPEIMLRQAFPWFGTLRARGDQEAAEAEALVHEIRAERDRVVEAVKLAYFDFALLRGNTDVLESQREILNYAAEVVEGRLALGLAQEDEHLRLSIERAELDDRLAQLAQMRPAMERRLNSAMGTPAETPRPWPAPAQVPPEPAGYAAVAAQAAEHNPRLAAFDPRVEATEHGARIARLSGFPRVSLGLEWVGMPDPPKERVARPRVQPLDDAMGAPATMAPSLAMTDSGDDEWMLNVGITLPVWRRRVRAAVEESRLMGSALRHEARAERLMVESDLAQAWFQYDDAKRRYRFYSESMIPLAYQTYESLQSRYATSSDGVEFLDLLESVRMLLEFQLAQLEAEKDWQAAAATLERIAGGQLPTAELAAIAPAEDAVPD